MIFEIYNEHRKRVGRDNAMRRPSCSWTACSQILTQVIAAQVPQLHELHRKHRLRNSQVVANLAIYSNL